MIIHWKYLNHTAYLYRLSCNNCSATPGGFLDFFPDPARHRAGADGPFDHPLPCPHQHLQQRHNQLAKGYIVLLIVIITVIVIVFCLSSLSSSLSTVHLVLITIINIVITNFRKVNKRYLIWQDVVNKYFDVQAEGLTAIEIWMLACILFVFGLYSFIFSEKNPHNFQGNVDNGW